MLILLLIVEKAEQLLGVVVLEPVDQVEQHLELLKELELVYQLLEKAMCIVIRQSKVLE